MFDLGARWSVAIVLGGFVGALSRLGLLELSHPAAGFPWPTFVANVAGAALLGFFVGGVFQREPSGRGLVPLLGTGFCGALTTFSGLQIETVLLLERGDVGVAIAYVGASIVAGLVAVVASERIAERRPG